MKNERFFTHDLLPFVVARASTDSTASFKPHMHRTLSIGAVERGTVSYNIDGKNCILTPGSLAVINPETLHACNPAANSKRSYSMLYLDKDWCSRLQQSMWGGKRFIKLEKVRIDDKSLYILYCRTMNHLTSDATHLQEKEQLLYDLVAGVFSIACRPLPKQSTATADRDTVEKLKRLLSEDLLRDLPLDCLARGLDANPYTLIRRFKAATGLTPHAYRMNCRIEQAKSLLRQGKDITDTALLCGFFDQSHFHRHFKAMTTVTPQEYRVNFVQ